jgi:hypothetical protein
MGMLILPSVDSKVMADIAGGTKASARWPDAITVFVAFLLPQRFRDFALVGCCFSIVGIS